MIVLIPLGGKGERFKKNGFKNPKALINIEDKPIIFHLLDNLKIEKKVSFIYIPYNKEYLNYDFENILKKNYPKYKFKFFVLEKQTEGAAETIYLALKNLYANSIRYPISLNNMKEMFDKPVLCLDSDSFYTIDIIQKWNGKNRIFTFTSKIKEPIFSYIKYDENNNITNIKEKVKISNDACTGAYGFESYYDLMENCKISIDDEKSKQLGEFYTSGVIKKMMNKDIIFENINIKNKNFFSLGTPEQVKLFEQTFLLDLDGTLVNTDPIYIKVWNDILKKYNLTCDENIFHSFIKGKSDMKFLKFLIPNIDNEDIKEISKLKDELFNNYIKKSDNIMYKNVDIFFEKIQNSKIAIVTSSNKSAASFLLKHYKLDNYINLLISADDVKNHKPHPMPYIKARNLLNRDNKGIIIFEDSESGYIAAKKIRDCKVCIYNNGKNNTLIKNIESINNNIIFDDYNKLEIMKLINLNFNNKNKKFLNYLKSILNFLPIREIYCKIENNLKTGYICDIDNYILKYFDGEEEEVVIKTSNYNNSLSQTALELNMYKNESYFYKNLSEIIMKSVNIPKCYSTFNYNNKEGIILENLLKYTGKFNIDLNNNIKILISIVGNIFKLHNKFYFTNDNEIIKLMQPLKKMKDITYYNKLVKKRYNKFIDKNKFILSEKEKEILDNINGKYETILEDLSTFPLSFCHGDLKSPNIFYKNNEVPYFLDWQYIHLNKGISDIAFLLVESINYDEKLVDLVLNYYYILIKQKNRNISYNEFLNDFKNSLCAFPFFVMVWFNSEDGEKLIDSAFPIRFMKNVLKYYNKYL